MSKIKNTKNKKLNQYVILSETKNLMRSFTNVQDDRESGRSMVEMLGVLAVIGVLSVAGIAGYSTAMKHHKANEAIKAISMLYISAQSWPTDPKTMHLDPLTYQKAYGVNSNPTGISSEGTKPAENLYAYSRNNIAVVLESADICNLVKDKIGTGVNGCANATPKQLNVLFN